MGKNKCKIASIIFIFFYIPECLNMHDTHDHFKKEKKNVDDAALRMSEIFNLWSKNL